jgi:DNA-binding GntR family transcriptional regulator
MPVPVVAEPISRVPTRETVAETLRAWIIDGTLAPEEVLRDSDLAQTFGISRTPVREALLHLEHEGLVESHPGRWTRVTPLDPALLVGLYPVWSELETLSSRLVTTQAGHLVDWPAIEGTAQAFADAVDAALADPGSVRILAAHKANACFHDYLLAAAGNPTLSNTLTPLRLTIRRFAITCPVANIPDRDSVGEHTAIMAAILAGDPDAAATTTRNHVHHDYQRLQVGWNLPTSG